MEIEKALNKSAVSGQGDTGTSSRSFGTLLSWLSDHKTPVFVIGTSNDFTVLPPELIRKGRFDEAMWLDLPTEKERVPIFNVLLQKYKRDPSKFNVKALAKASRDFTGAEIEQVIVSTLFKCFSNNGREVESKDLLTEIDGTIPQAKINAAALDEMRRQATGKLRMAAADGNIAEIPLETRHLDL